MLLEKIHCFLVESDEKNKCILLAKMVTCFRIWSDEDRQTYIFHNQIFSLRKKINQNINKYKHNHINIKWSTPCRFSYDLLYSYSVLVVTIKLSTRLKPLFPSHCSACQTRSLKTTTRNHFAGCPSVIPGHQLFSPFIFPCWNKPPLLVAFITVPASCLQSINCRHLLQIVLHLPTHRALYGGRDNGKCLAGWQCNARNKTVLGKITYIIFVHKN
jgi:hypothetical protein